MELRLQSEFCLPARLAAGRYVSARFGRPAASPLVDAREPSRFGYSHWLAVPTSAHTRVIVDQIGNHTQSSRVWQMHLASGFSAYDLLLVVRIFKFLRICGSTDPQIRRINCAQSQRSLVAVER